ncbi:TVP38/TMEM64 family protein [Paenibacillus sp. DMB20]|uniref:TVP38/TMEM64 family protein n=1 Tax=Paenibacillus sp. DMB20 TaxID=1642570 RepID=UPI0006274DE2|nr:VTT domain-containing protein [Paenibacillus sp. DMB20]KKO52127.1 hypothetical protein XI25_22000 [Paenibacillus sp. DMB20]
MKKWLTPAVYILALVFSYTYRNEIWIWLKSAYSPFPVLLLCMLLALFPILPYKAVIAVLGYAYGTFWGAAAAWIGTTAAAVIVYVVSAALYREPGRRFLKRYSLLDSFTAKLEKHPFTAILLVRMVPVVPQMAVNIYAGVASIPFWTYTAASGLGKIPVLLLYAYLGNGFAHSPVRFAILTAAVLAASLAGVLGLTRYLRRKGT